MSKVRAKFICTSIESFANDSTAKLVAVINEEGENKDFSDSTPVGSLEIGVSGDVPAVGFFIPGESYYLDFIKAN